MMGLSHFLLLFFIIFFKGCKTSTFHQVPASSTTHMIDQCALAFVLSFFMLQFSTVLSYCHDEERTALLQFKQCFTISASASGSQGAYPKVLSWKPAQGGNKTNCCTWDGVECDERTGRVIDIDLSSSYLYGNFDSNNTLFRLVHLERLNLADNNFNYSQIPTTLGNFPRLRYLNLSSSVFSGHVPSEVSQLSKLSSLDLSANTVSSQGLLKLKTSNLAGLVQNLTSLETLYLSGINISSRIPDFMANMSFLTSLALRNCELFGEFPTRIFELPNLKFFSVRFNQELSGYLPEFNQTSPLTRVILAGTNFSGNLPSSIGKLDSLEDLDVGACRFSGMVPFSLGNLKQLNYLDLSSNKFSGPIPASLANLTQLTYLSLATNNFLRSPLSWVGKLTKLTSLDLESINLNSSIPYSLSNFTQLTYLSLRSNQLSGPIPSWLGNLSRLVTIDFVVNSLIGSVPVSLFDLMELKQLSLSVNELDGNVDFCKLRRGMTILQLGGNKLEVIAECGMKNTTVVPQLRYLGLSSCNIKEFPHFLMHQQSLRWLDLSLNKLHGQIPKWMWNTSTQSLSFLNIKQNCLSSFGQPTLVLPWVNLQVLFAAGNQLTGSPPIPPENIVYYSISDNNLSGEISPSICKLISLQYLDLSNNKLSGTIPQCLGNFSDDLRVLNLRNNSFQGILPQLYSNASNLRMIDVSYNQFHGQLPRSLANCGMLESLVLSNNEFNDVFPIWLGMLPYLKLLAMNRNEFNGVIKTTTKTLHFPELLILDLSHNSFRGEFPSEYILSGSAMRGITQSQPTYMDTSSGLNIPGAPLFGYDFSMTITNKGVVRYYQKILEDLGFLDISSNKFAGDIPEYIGNLKGLQFLNISHNIFSGCIPSSLGNLIVLESLDMSQNKLSGEIPQKLTQLTSLAYFNVSHNNLTGSIPIGRQFQTFESTSYEENSGLCGDPLPKKCGNSNAPSQLPPSSVEENDSGSEVELDWIFMLAGFCSGLVVGVVLVNEGIKWKHRLFLEIVGMLIRLLRRIRRPRRN